MPHYEFFCHTCSRPFSKMLPPLNTRKARLSVRAVAARKWSRDGSTPSARSRACKQIEQSQSVAVVHIFARDKPRRDALEP